MKLANVSTSQLEYLRAALDATSWKNAAAAVGVSPSALSQGLAELERRLGVDLFVRQGRRQVPTAEAIRAGDYADRILAELRELSRWAHEVRGGSAGELSIGMIDTAAIHHYGDMLVGFRRANPDLNVRLMVRPSNDLLELLRAGELDAAVVVDPEPEERLTLTPLISEPLYIYAPPGTRIGKPAAWGPWVGFPADSRTRSLIARSLRRRDIDYSVVAESSQPAVLREMVRLGMGWCVLPETDAETEPHALTRAAPEPVATRTLTLTQRADRPPTPATAALLRTLLD